MFAVSQVATADDIAFNTSRYKVRFHSKLNPIPHLIVYTRLCLVILLYLFLQSESHSFH